MNHVIAIRGAEEHNLKSVDVDIPHGGLNVVSGPSGSGKTSLVFDTLYVEARRRYLMTMTDKGAIAITKAPKVRSIDGLSPAVALSQHRFRHHPRSTVATMAGLHDYLRALFHRVGSPSCLRCGSPVRSQRFEEAFEVLAGLPDNTKLLVLAPRYRKIGESDAELGDWLQRSGYRRIRVHGEFQVADNLNLSGIMSIEVAVDRLAVKPNTRRRLKGSLQAALDLGGGQATAIVEGGDEKFVFAVKPSCITCGEPFVGIDEGLFSFNSSQGACKDCKGLGIRSGMQFNHLFEDGRANLEEGLGDLWCDFGHDELRDHLECFCAMHELTLETSVADFACGARELLWKGKRDRSGFPGLQRLLERLYAEAAGRELDWFEDRLGDTSCETCDGTRYCPESRAIEIAGETIASVCGKSISGAVAFFDHWEPSGNDAVVAEVLRKRILGSLMTIVNLGMDYLTLDRRSDTISSGEFQRLRLASSLGSNMTQVLYIMDEPTTGLHACDVARLLDALASLRADGNTILVVEHDQEVLSKADLLIDMGPGAGAAGGSIVARGTPEEVGRTQSLTGRYLSGEISVGTSKERQPGSKGWLKLNGLRGHNLKGIDVELPLGCLVGVTGISGSGKSSVVQGTLFPVLAGKLQRAQRRPLAFESVTGAEQLDRIICVDQKPIGRSLRSVIATYTGLSDSIRRLFAKVPEARLRAYNPGHFSFNTSEGMCPDCAGSGVARIRSELFEGIEAECGTCSGRRFKREVLDVRFRDHSISDVLDLDVDAARQLFQAVPEVERILAVMIDVGLAYIHLGQSAQSLSGGEAQRVKLSTELGKPRNDRTIYVLDEPTTGLHLEDVRYLLDLLQRLVEQGNSVVVVEHHIEFVACSDYVIDLGPGAGEAGGDIVACGTPNEIVENKVSRTGEYLQRYFKRMGGLV